jgi:hypothetical protein
VIKFNRSGFGLTQAALFVSVLERLDFAVLPPELYIMAIDKLLRAFYWPIRHRGKPVLLPGQNDRPHQWM